jgi:hypothetical protein
LAAVSPHVISSVGRFLFEIKDSENKKIIMFRSFLMISLLLIFAQLVNAQNTPRELARQLIKDNPDVREVVQNTNMTLDAVIKELNSKKVDLNGDGNLEYIVSGLICGQNCSHWIYQKDRAKFVQIPFEGTFTDLDILPTKTKGYRDLRGRMFLNAAEGALQTFRFDGFKYVPSSCSLEIYGYTDRRGNYHTYKTPRIKKGCD